MLLSSLRLVSLVSAMDKQHNYSAAAAMAELDYSSVDYMLDQVPPPDQFSGFADVLQFADFGPKLALNEPGNSSHDPHCRGTSDPSLRLEFLGTTWDNKSNKNSGKRKRARAMKTTEEAESQRMTHIAVERNRRKQMNEHLRVLRTLMPSSYVQRGDQASIVGGAIEFVRELEELLQCLESQKRRKLYGEALPLPSSQPLDPSNDQIITLNDDDNTANVDGLMVVAPNAGPAVGLQEEAAESRTAIADVEVKLLGFDAFIKILSRRRPGQLIKAISGLQDLHFTILHTNVTTIEQTVLYSFNIKTSSETRFSAEGIASSVQQIFTFIHANQEM